MAHRHFALQRGKDLLPVIANGEMDDRTGACEHQSEKERGSNMSHSLSPILSTANVADSVWFLVPCFC
jgi:hypothetical protein